MASRTSGNVISTFKLLQRDTIADMFATHPLLGSADNYDCSTITGGKSASSVPTLLGRFLPGGMLSCNCLTGEKRESGPMTFRGKGQPEAQCAVLMLLRRPLVATRRDQLCRWTS